MTAPATSKELADAVFEILGAAYGEPAPRPRLSPLDELIQTVLSQNTADLNSDRAYAALEDRYHGDWERVRIVPAEELADTIRHGGLADLKAGRIQSVLNQISERVGELDLGFLAALSVEEGRTFLRSLDGVGPKTAACVLLFACGKPAMPVDTHVFRVSQRLGLLPPRVAADRAHEVLEDVVQPERMYAFHMHLIRHGREVCKAQRPRCSSCPAQAICAFGKRLSPA